ncbi:ATP synthase F0 subcomplex A subunit [Geosporobacter subterraneus DSM 17957]|uniref:ATP synthase subunit a n=1 Tax=Geosporobacter subterraneus DSM 17957 TaxID=1121919 RepID=A0A1M6CG22_9FIRM|nr:F0F1 ATP synthase subunit A [Geosporobacter subterraneus]SHI59936.1 ATP synthase F0 subcomplex A subunit [Geosporobacter subterraneus DSM 17957]
MEGGFGARVIFELPGGILITETVTTTWIIMAVLTIFALVATRRFEKVPRGLQNVVELLVEAIYKLTAQTMGEDKKAFAPYIGTLLMYLVCANLAGLFGFRPPTADVNTTMALALMTFFMIHFFGMKRKGVGRYLKGFLEPFPVMLPLNVIGELATPISLSFRLFGNIVGGLIIMNLLYGALATLSQSVGIPNIPVFQTAIPTVFHLYFDVFAGVLQSFIFAMLTMVFVSIAMD